MNARRLVRTYTGETTEDEDRCRTTVAESRHRRRMRLALERQSTLEKSRTGASTTLPLQRRRRHQKGTSEQRMIESQRRAALLAAAVANEGDLDDSSLQETTASSTTSSIADFDLRHELRHLASDFGYFFRCLGDSFVPHNCCGAGGKENL